MKKNVFAIRLVLLVCFFIHSIIPSFGAVYTADTKRNDADNCELSIFLPAMLRITEVAPNILSSRDLVELVVVQGGSTNGMTLLQNDVVLATLPDVTVSTGDIIVVHLNPNGSNGDAGGSETTSKNQFPQATFSANYDNAWDFQGGTTGIAYTHRVLQIKDAVGNRQDAVPFALTTGTPIGAFITELQAIQAEGLWLPADCGGAPCTNTSTPTAVEISAIWDGVGTTRTANTVQRISSLDTNTRNDWSVGVNTLGSAISPTAASVKVSGKVLANRRGLANALVILTDVLGETRTARTNAFGYYHFADVPTGANYIFSVLSKRYSFAPQIVNINEELTDLNFSIDKNQSRLSSK